MESDVELAALDLERELGIDTLPTELHIVLGRLARRLRRGRRFPLTQAAVLGRLERDGPLNVGRLASLESVRPQSMSQTLFELEAEGLLKRRPDPSDGRRTQIAITGRGRRSLEVDRVTREGWLGAEIAEFTPEEQMTLHRAVTLLSRLADAH